MFSILNRFHLVKVARYVFIDFQHFLSKADNFFSLCFLLCYLYLTYFIVWILLLFFARLRLFVMLANKINEIIEKKNEHKKIYLNIFILVMNQFNGFKRFKWRNKIARLLLINILLFKFFLCFSTSSFIYLLVIPALFLEKI